MKRGDRALFFKYRNLDWSGERLPQNLATTNLELNQKIYILRMLESAEEQENEHYILMRYGSMAKYFDFLLDAVMHKH